MTSILDDVKAFNSDLQAFSLISMASTNPIVIEAQEAREALQEVPGLALSAQLIRDRKIYRDAFFEGVGVVEMTTNKGTPEIQLLAQEMLDG
jgi:cellulose biosynthesis protein BcsQ